jgi:hypothetical protein
VTTPADFFSMPEPDVQRGQGGSPMLIPRGLEASGIRSVYTRASYMADFLEAKDHIHKWEMRYLAKAMGQNEDLAALAACEVYSTGVSDAVFGREKTQSGRNLDEIIKRAFDRVRLHEKADRGTAVHGFTEPRWWEAEPHDAVPERLRGPVNAFWETNLREGIEIIGTEMFTANDITMSAGTFDHLIAVHGHPLLGGELVVADKKTGALSPFEWSIQIATYAYGDPYDTSTDTRPAWPGEINQSWGLVWQIDCNPKVADDRRVKLHLVDLEFGWRMAQLAAEVRDGHKRTDIAAPYDSPSFNTRLTCSNTHAALRALWNSTTDPGQRALVEAKASTL